LIILAVDAKRYESAYKIARTVQEQRPKSAVGFSLEGEISAAQRKWDMAAAAYQAGMQRAASTDLAIKLHSALLSSGKGSESERFAASWLKSHPKDAAFLLHLGDVAIARKDYDAAERHYLSALATQPDNVIALNNLAWVTGRLGKDGAIAYAEKANRLAPDQPVFMDTLAMLLAEKNEYAKATDLQSKALTLQPGNGGLRLNLARIYIKAGDKARARAELETLAKLGDKFPAQAEVSALLKSL
jgi:cellulose synthase operon protein C